MAQNQEPLRVLQVSQVFAAAGIESFIMNMYRHMDRSKVQYDFMIMRDADEYYDQEAAALGAKKYTIQANESLNTLARVAQESWKLHQFLKENPYEIVHIHYTTPLRSLYALAAKKAGVKRVIYHSHSAEVSGKSDGKLFIYNFLKKRLTGWATDYFACSKAAARWMFDEPVLKNGLDQVINNGIDTTRFAYNPQVREKIREELGFKDELVLLQAGRFSDQKNQLFSLKLLRHMKDQGSDAKLLLLGDGSMKDQILAEIEKLNLQKDVILTGVVNNVEDYLSAADCYLMPSLYEGLPVAGIEAQCAGLTSLFSDLITDEVKVCDRAVFLNLNDPLDKWAAAAVKTPEKDRLKACSQVRKNGYEVKDVASSLQDFYLEAAGRKLEHV